MTVYQHLGYALRIIQQESDWRKWGPMIDALTPDQQEECRPWLRMQAKLAQRRERDSRASQPTAFPPSSKSRAPGSRKPRAGKT